MTISDREQIALLDIWTRGCAAARAGLEPRDCPYPWQPGWNNPYLAWIRGLADTYAEMGARTKAARRARVARKMADYHAACTARPWSPFRLDGTVPVWFVRLMRRVFA